MHFSFRSDPTIVLHGYSPEAPADILKRVATGTKPSSLKGDFILVAEGIEHDSGKPLTVFVSTIVSAIPYFYYQSPTACAHAPNVFDCCRVANLPWEWDYDALAQVALFDHILDNRSLHLKIKRVPAASVMVYTEGKLQIDTEPFWQEAYQSPRNHSRIADAGDTLLTLLSELPTEHTFSLSLSAGYDSRALLAGLAHLKRDVHTGCMGHPDATDPRIAEQLARATGYPFSRVDLTAEDYPAAAKEILTTTSGEKVFLHWHTGIYAQKVPFRQAAIHLAGSNGEFARSSLFDKGFIASTLDRFHISGWDKWIERQHQVNRCIAPEITANLSPHSVFVQALNPHGMVQSVYQTGYRFGDGLDLFYATQRVRNFIGLGIALYRTRFTTTSPFLDARFIRYAINLRRTDKLANRFPRAVISQLQPKLLDFPTDESGIPMRTKPSLMYFRGAKGGIKPYQRTKEAQGLPTVIAWAQAGYQALGGDLAQLSTNHLLQHRVGQWNFAITVGATLELIKKLGITH